MKVLHIITGLKQGGAESVLFRLVTYKTPKVVHRVVSMMDLGTYGERLRNAGITVDTLDMPQGKLTFKGVVKLWKMIREIKPDIVQTWMYHADLIGGLVARLAGCKNVFWGIVNFNLHPNVTGISTRFTAKACALLSNCIPQRIITCSVGAIQSHQAIGYSKNKFVTIPLGYDLQEFWPNKIAGENLRYSWSIGKNDVVIGCVARWDPQKDHHNLLQAFALIKEKWPMVRCVLAGPGMFYNNKDLTRLIFETNGDDNNISAVGLVDDIPAAMCAFDLHILSSLGEAFPNVVAEAMACETPCIVTDVGDAAFIVGETGWVVPPGNTKKLSMVINEALSAMKESVEWEERKADCRSRIIEKFSISRMADSYTQAWESVKS